MTKGSSVKSFEEVYKTAYSHGLENIYALENVDIKTVRPLHLDVEAPSAQLKKRLPRSSLRRDEQLSFNFGAAYRSSVEHFVLREPIQVLGLTRYIENSLLSQGKKVLRDLLSGPTAGFGQGHLDEINNKLNEYLAGRHLTEARAIDYGAWLKACVADIDRKRLYLALEPYRLHQHVSLTTGESIELRRLTLEKRQEWCEEASALLRADAKKQRIDADFWEITEVFIKPWMDLRGGIATELELLERLQNLSDGPESIGPVLDFFRDNYFKGAFPLNRCLEPLDAGLFASTPRVADLYDMIVEKAQTYFYKNDSVYRFDMLAACLEREFAGAWMGFPGGFLAAVLKKSPLFYTYKTADCGLYISLA